MHRTILLLAALAALPFFGCAKDATTDNKDTSTMSNTNKALVAYFSATGTTKGVAERLAGAIGAAALMRPSKSVDDLEVKSVRKKYKDKKFAAGCNRDVIRKGAELVGLDLPAAIAVCIDGMKPYAAETGLLPKE